jgi:hypothetical protein
MDLELSRDDSSARAIVAKGECGAGGRNVSGVLGDQILVPRRYDDLAEPRFVSKPRRLHDLLG